MNELLERMKASQANWTPESEARRREWGRRHEEFRQRQALAARKKIQYMTPGLYSYPGDFSKTFPHIFVIDENHRLWGAERGASEYLPYGGRDPDMLWTFRRLA
jgi:hypothetical protein